jgi:hypothetical protein
LESSVDLSNSMFALIMTAFKLQWRTVSLASSSQKPRNTSAVRSPFPKLQSLKSNHLSIIGLKKKNWLRRTLRICLILRRTRKQ